MSYNNKNHNGKGFRNKFVSKKEQNINSNICDVCKKEQFKYKCSKCKSKTVKICGMACYKEHNTKGEHFELSEVNLETPKSENTANDLGEFEYLIKNDKIQSLLQYNTVKYHLHKIYQLLQMDHNAIQEDTIKNRQDLEQSIARYLSCFRENGIYKNVAIEEFIQTCLQEMEKHQQLWNKKEEEIYYSVDLLLGI